MFHFPVSQLVLNQEPSGEGNGTPLQYSCLESPMDGGAWLATVHRVAKSQTRLSDFTFTFYFHALEKEMATHSSILVWRIPGMGAWWAAVYGVAQSQTQLMWLSSSRREVGGCESGEGPSSCNSHRLSAWPIGNRMAVDLKDPIFQEGLPWWPSA